MVCLYFLADFKLKTARGLFLFTALTVFQRRRTERCAIVFIYLFTIMYVFVQTAKLCLNLDNIFTVDVLLIRFEPLGNGLRTTLTSLGKRSFSSTACVSWHQIVSFLDVIGAKDNEGGEW